MRGSAILLAALAVALGAGRARAAAGVRVEGAVTCPSPADVERELSVVLPSAERAGEARVVRLDRAGARLHLILHAADGARISRRTLAATAGCGDLAKAAAVVIASWQLELGAELPTPGAPTLEPPELATPVSVGRAPVPKRLGLELGAAAAAAPGAGGLVPGVEVGLRAVSESGGFGLHLGGFGLARREAPLGGGVAAWRRAGLLFGPVFRQRAGPFEGEVGLALALAWLEIEGRSFARSRRASAVDPGGRAALRLGLRRGRALYTVGTGVAGWLTARRAELVYEEGAGDGGGPIASRRLPRVEAHFMAGVDIRIGP